MIVAVPLIVGLMWNKWAGGTTGFILGSIYTLWYAIYGNAFAGRPVHPWSSNIGLLGYLLSAMLIGYMAGALNQKSTQLSRLIFSGLTAALVGGLFLFFTEQQAPAPMFYGWFGLFVTMTPRIVFGIVMPLIVKLILRHQATHMEIPTRPEAHS